MRLLLDTHIWVWGLLDPSRLSRGVSRELERPAARLWLSPVTTWEVLMLIAKKRLTLPGDADPVEWLRDALGRTPVREAPLNHEVALATTLVDLQHRDPADRLLAATAMVYDLTLVTADTRFFRARQFAVLPNR